MTQFVGHKLGCVRGGRPVFADLGFVLPAGGALILTGANGTGKSSLLRLMAALLAPEAGDLLWGGVPIKNDRDSHRARVHYVGHQDAVKSVLTVEENLLFWTALRGAGRSRIRAALEVFGLGPIADLPARLLSAGQRRRLALARLLAAPTELWLLDEPTVSLDAFSSAALSAAIAEHRARDGRVVVATHTSLEIPDSTRLSLERFAANRMDMAI